MNKPPAAPRAAYLLTAAMADNTHDESGQRDILAALGEQTRVALTMLRARLGAEIEMDWDSTARVVCSEALAAARELVRPEPGEWSLLECAHCREVIAKAMCCLQIQAYFRLGFTLVRIATMCRQSAGEPESAARS